MPPSDQYLTVSAAFAVGILLSAGFTPVIRRVAVRLRLLDHAITARKIHGQPVPRLGGLAIVAAFFGALAAARQLGPLGFDERTLALLLAAIAIALLGVLDDLRGAGASQKLVVQTLAALFVYQLGLRIEVLANPTGADIALGPFSLVLTVLWIVGVTNAFNLIDGLDGLAGGVALVALAVNGVVAHGRDQPELVLLCVALAGAVLGFLRHNLHPASIFMGDTGSMFLGFTIATIAIQAQQKSTTAVALLVPIATLGLPILDTLLAMARRVVLGRPVFHADRDHIHHRLLVLGFTHRSAVLVLWGVSGVFGVLALGLAFGSQRVTFFVASSALCVVVALLWRLGYLGGSGLMADRRDVQQALAVMQIAERLQIGGPSEIWKAVCAVSAAIDADCVRLVLTEKGSDAERVTRTFAAGFDEEGIDRFIARFHLPGEGADGGFVEFGWEHPSARIERRTDEAIREFCEGLATGPSRRRLSTKGEATVLKLRR